ncbi:uncharacterized protein [Montipora foliosa]|uniref:uncharacterized protein n=1 Tax=Montipora foliosa TaxID=591990 RepID=UPI0035F1C3B5
MRRRDNIKPELNEDYKHLCSSSVPFTEFLFGNDANLSKQLKDLAEATKVSKKLNPKVDGHKSNGYRGYKHAKSKGFGYKYSSRGQGTQAIKNLNWKRPGPPYTKKDEGRRPNKLQQFVPAWKDITDDPEVLDWIEHCHLEFIDGVPPVQETDYKVIQFNDAEAAIIESEIVQLLNKGVIVESPHFQGEFVLSIFVRLKKNGVDYRIILNLKELNKFIVYRHFKMDSLKTVTDLMSQGCYMASVDIKDAYYTVPIATEHQKFLKFRQKGYLSSSYIDDCYLQGATYGECHDNVQETLMLLGDLGFPIHNEKSVLTPSQVLTFLGFVLNSVTMTVQLTKSRKQKLKTVCLTLVNKETCTIQSVAEVIGVIVSSFPGVEHGPLHYRSLERDKSHALRENKGNFGASMILSPSSRAELNWWISNVDTSLKLISHGEPELHIQTDASAHSWGGLRGEQRTGGRWTQQEASHHINY